jgi:hypothetical protein
LLYGPQRPRELSLLRTAWLRNTNTCPVLFHAVLSSSAAWVSLATSHLDAGEQRGLYHMYAYHYHQSIRELRADIGKPGFIPSDGHVLALTILGCQSELPKDGDEPYPLSPLGDIQRIRLESQYVLEPAHINALAKFIHLKGGLGTVSFRGLLHVLELYVTTYDRRTATNVPIASASSTPHGQPPYLNFHWHELVQPREVNLPKSSKATYTPPARSEAKRCDLISN